jgi:CheY-like chemotaxis protein
VLLNLVSNAMKFTRPGGVISIRIREIASSSKGHATYEFHVKDTGIGMSREFTEHIFEPFTREDSATTSGIPGSGLGMAITKGIVDMQNGQIDVYSEEGKGSEFVVTLTFRLQKEHKELVVLEELEGIRSLVVDDDINACQSVSHMLRQIGLRAEWTMYGREAVVRTQEALEMGDRYQVYIIDWMMPDMNGIETARRIRKIVGEDAPIIILSAYDWAEIEEEAREAGVTGFVSKPIFVSDLQNVLMRYCSGKYEANEEEKYSFHRGLEGKRVLLAEDNRMNQEIAATIMEEEGLIVDIVENGQEACDKVKNSVPGYYDLVLMDIQMPVMDGYQAAQEIRKLENRQLANIPIVAMTANAFESDRQLALESGMNGHLPKPISIKELFKIIQQITVKPD